MQLMVKRQVKQQWVALPKMPVDLEQVTTAWSDKIVEAIDIVAPSLPASSVIAGTALPAIRFVCIWVHQMAYVHLLAVIALLWPFCISKIIS